MLAMTTLAFVFRTIYTRAERHTYVDPDYSFTDHEMDTVRMHKEGYGHFMHGIREDLQNKQREKYG